MRTPRNEGDQDRRLSIPGGKARGPFRRRVTESQGGDDFQGEDDDQGKRHHRGCRDAPPVVRETKSIENESDSVHRVPRRTHQEEEEVQLRENREGSERSIGDRLLEEKCHDYVRGQKECRDNPAYREDAPVEGFKEGLFRLHLFHRAERIRTPYTREAINRDATTNP